MLSMVRDDTLEGRRVTGFSSSVELVYDYDSPLHISGSTLEAGSERGRGNAPRQFRYALDPVPT